jgi:hypothetical protein
MLVLILHQENGFLDSVTRVEIDHGDSYRRERDADISILKLKQYACQERPHEEGKGTSEEIS